MKEKKSLLKTRGSNSSTGRRAKGRHSFHMEDAVAPKNPSLHVRTGLNQEGRWDSGRAAVAPLADLFSPTTPHQITQQALCKHSLVPWCTWPSSELSKGTGLCRPFSLQCRNHCCQNQVFGTQTILNLVQNKAPTQPSSKV